MKRFIGLILILAMLSIFGTNNFIRAQDCKPDPPPGSEDGFTIRKELAYYRTGESEPSFYNIKGIEFPIFDDQDYIGTYGIDGFCRGSDNLWVTDGTAHAFTKGFSHEDGYGIKSGFDYQEEVFLFYYDKQSDTFYELRGTVYDYVALANDPNVLPVEHMTHSSLTFYFMFDPYLGDEITLNIDAELVAPVLSPNPDITEVKTGMTKYANLNLKNRNVKKIAIDIVAGPGTAYKSNVWPYSYFFEAEPISGTTTIKLSALDYYDNTYIESIVQFNTLVTEDDQVKLFEDDRIAFWEQDGNLHFRSKIGETYLSFVSRSAMQIGNVEYIPMARLLREVKKNKSGEVNGWYMYYTGPEHVSKSKQKVFFEFIVPGAIPEPPVTDLLYENDKFKLQSVDSDIVGVLSDEDILLVKFLYNGRFVTKRMGTSRPVFGVSQAVEKGLSIIEYKVRNGRKWDVYPLDVVIYEAQNPDAGIVKFVANPPEVVDIFYDHAYIKCGYDNDQVVVSNFTTESMTFKFYVNNGFIISTSVKPGASYEFASKKLADYSGRSPIGFEWCIKNSPICEDIPNLIPMVD